MLISDEYKKLNEQLHESNYYYGASGKKNVDTVIYLSNQFKTKEILDYGCGKSTLSENLPFSIEQYDPAIPKYAMLPNPADIVICTDVMEHIEPECLDDVLTHIKSLTKKACYMVICTVPAKKFLADGRNAHICLYPKEWWVDKLNEYFDIDSIEEAGADIAVLLTPKEPFNGIKI